MLVLRRADTRTLIRHTTGAKVLSTPAYPNIMKNIPNTMTLARATSVLPLPSNTAQRMTISTEPVMIKLKEMNYIVSADIFGKIEGPYYHLPSA